MGCLARAGCLLLLVIGGAVAWLNRDRLMHREPSAAPAALEGQWLPITAAGAKRTTDALGKLSSKTGPVFVTLSASDVASYIVSSLRNLKEMPSSADSFAARVVDDRVLLRANMKTSELGSAVGGVLGALLHDRERVEMGGTLKVIGNSLAEFRVTEVRIRGVPLPGAIISQLVDPLVHQPHPKGLDENALPFVIPGYIGDLRVANGKITLYKNVQ